MAGLPNLDLAAYFDRIGYDGPREPTFATLEALQAAHLGRIPFENIDVRLGRPISLDLPALEAKLVGARRGGYCFEQNTFFAAVLRKLGFDVHTLEARVRPPGAQATLPRTHMTLRVDVEGVAWLADVGFGGDGPLAPVSLDGRACGPASEPYRIDAEPGEVLVLRRRWQEAWHDLYAFTLAPALPVDYELANYYTSTHPESRFVRTLTLQRSTATARHILRGRTYTIRTGEAEATREVRGAEIPALVREAFGLECPPEDVLRALGEPEGPPKRSG